MTVYCSLMIKAHAWMTGFFKCCYGNGRWGTKPGRSDECPSNVHQRTSKRGPNADVSGRPQNVRQRTSKRGPNADVLKTSASERYKADQIRTSSERPPANVTISVANLATFQTPLATFFFKAPSDKSSDFWKNLSNFPNVVLTFWCISLLL